VMMSAEAETSEIIRRRLFEWEGLTHDAQATVREYADWLAEHHDAVPTWFPIDSAYEAFAATNSFSMTCLRRFRSAWRLWRRPARPRVTRRRWSDALTS
jgi:uncharacterized iron-regulated protein